jgi:4-hydroxybenzoate polyprenyltransferase
MKNWLQLFRAPNLFTVPGDPLAGFLLAGGNIFQPAVAAVIIASLLLYGFGLLLNDLMDLPEDRAERPSRPLPSGAVKPRAVASVAAAVAIAALGICAFAGARPFYCACAIVLAVIAYDCGMKKIPFVGAINMGACRGLNVLLGASLAQTFATPALAAAALIAAYITAVTLLARRETENPAIPPLIGKLIRALILIQAFFCALSGSLSGWICAAILALALWPLSRIVGKKFYGS